MLVHAGPCLVHRPTWMARSIMSMVCPFIRYPLHMLRQACLTLGVVYDPMRDECFSAEFGKGAWLNGQPIHPSLTPDLDHALLVTGFPYDIRTNPENNLDHYAHFALRSQGVRRLGSAALDLCYVACGRFDGFWELRLKPGMWLRVG